MKRESDIRYHYSVDQLLWRIERGIEALGLTRNQLSVADLAPVDEFHIGGRTASEHLFNQLSLKPEQHWLDIGCGLGGAARFVGETYRCQVSGIDLTDDYLTVAKALSSWVELDAALSFCRGSALQMPYDAASFEGAYMLHVGMNIENKQGLFDEVARVLKPGACYAIYDIMQLEEGELTYPVPWASVPGHSFVATIETYKAQLDAAGFELQSYTSRAHFADNFLTQLMQKVAQQGPGPLGLHLLMGEQTGLKIKNMARAVKASTIAPVEIIARKM
ncbi:MAG: class I SAM-dependent methyltransferase [Pseudomonadales bacterium]